MQLLIGGQVHQLGFSAEEVLITLFHHHFVAVLVQQTRRLEEVRLRPCCFDGREFLSDSHRSCLLPLCIANSLLSYRQALVSLEEDRGNGMQTLNPISTACRAQFAVANLPERRSGIS